MSDFRKSHFSKKCHRIEVQKREEKTNTVLTFCNFFTPKLFIKDARNHASKLNPRGAGRPHCKKRPKSWLRIATAHLDAVRSLSFCTLFLYSSYPNTIQILLKPRTNSYNLVQIHTTWYRVSGFIWFSSKFIVGFTSLGRRMWPLSKHLCLAQTPLTSSA